MHLLFPSSMLAPSEPDPDFVEQIGAFGAAGFASSLCSIEEMEAGRNGLRGNLPAGSIVLYRGWMLNPAQYELLVGRIAAAGCSPFVSKDAYLAAHYLPNWYPLVEEMTPATKIFIDLDRIDLTGLSGNKFFVKDFVKSLKTSVGSVIDDPAQLKVVIDEMIHFRGQIEGGLCIREYEEFVPGSETRYFVVDSVAYAADPAQPIPDIVAQAAARIPSPFFSIDIATRADGVQRIVEIGDGQVSDIVGWRARRLADVLKSTLTKSHICSH